MIGLDTNVLARLFVDDDPIQTAAARKFVGSRCTNNDPGFIDRIALCETVWVLTRAHGYDRSKIVSVIEELLASQDMILENAESVRAALHVFATHSVDFADALIAQVNRSHGSDETATFDRKAAKLDGFVLVSQSR
jgi:predicted nucleic-acid-binding protein